MKRKLNCFVGCIEDVEGDLVVSPSRQYYVMSGYVRKRLRVVAHYGVCGEMRIIADFRPLGSRGILFYSDGSYLGKYCMDNSDLLKAGVIRRVNRGFLEGCFRRKHKKSHVLFCGYVKR